MSLILDKINYVYSEGTAYQIQALKDVNLEIRDGQFIGVIGHTGSGKSTLIQHLNGLVKATSGTIYFNGQDIYDEDFDLRELRKHPSLPYGNKDDAYSARSQRNTDGRLSYGLFRVWLHNPKLSPL